MDSINALIVAHNADLAAAWKMVLAHKVGAAVLLFLTSGTAASLAARLLNLIPMDPIFAAIKAAAAGVSRAGNMSAFRLIYQPLEDWFEKFIMGAAKAVCEGLQLDSQVTKAQDVGATPQGASPGPLPAPVPEAGAPAAPPQPTPPGLPAS